MKQILQLLFLFLIVFISRPCYAGDKDEIALMVTSDGATKDDAIKNALRTAIEQTYGVFVSANTDILNDDLVKDEIATISSGNIKKFTEVSYSKSENSHTVTLDVIVSKGKLLSYAKSKGAECELDGAALVGNIELLILNTENEEVAIRNLIKEFEEQIPSYFDYAIYTEKFTFTEKEMHWRDRERHIRPRFYQFKPETMYNGDVISIPFKVMATLNKNGVTAISDFFKKLSMIGILSEESSGECKEYFTMPFNKIMTNPHYHIDESYPKYPKIYLRSKKSVEMLKQSFIKNNTINKYLADFYLDLGDGDKDNKSIDTIGDITLMHMYFDERNSYPSDAVEDKEGAEFFFRCGWINLPKNQVRLLRNIKVVHN